jgi:hypothetical protein
LALVPVFHIDTAEVNCQPGFEEREELFRNRAACNHSFLVKRKIRRQLFMYEQVIASLRKSHLLHMGFHMREIPGCDTSQLGDRCHDFGAGDACVV